MFREERLDVVNNYLYLLLIPIIGFFLTGIIVSILFIFIERPKNRVYSQYVSQYYGNYWKDKKYPNIVQVLQVVISEKI